MSEYVTAEFLREYAAEELDAYALPDEAEVVRRAAATIEALQAQLAERAPASVDTDEARRKAVAIAAFAAGGHAKVWGNEFLLWADTIGQLADALDASRAECERLRAELREVRMYGRSPAGMDDTTCGQSLGAGQ